MTFLTRTFQTANFCINDKQTWILKSKYLNLLPLFLLFSLTLFFSSKVQATFSIVACEAKSGVCGAAVATNNLAVGASVLHVEANVGALVSQFETHPSHGPLGLALLADKVSPAQVLQQLLIKDNDFEGGSTADRQIAMVSADGKISSWTGENANKSSWAGQLQAQGVSVQGNGLYNKDVLKAMLQSFQTAQGTFPSRLLSALEAGQQAGGQSNGQMSSALIVKTPQGFPFDIDLRVDAHKTPIDELRHLLNLHQARQLVIDARRLANIQPEKARKMLEKALEPGQNWDRVLVRGIQVASLLGDEDLVKQLKQQLIALNPTMYRQTFQ